MVRLSQLESEVYFTMCYVKKQDQNETAFKRVGKGSGEEKSSPDKLTESKRQFTDCRQMPSYF